MGQKILTLEKARRLVKKMRGKKVLVGGCFDILHIGHVRFLKAAKKRGDVLIVALESDIFIRRIKKRTPFQQQKERAAILASLSCVDMVILLPYLSSFDEYRELVGAIAPSIIAVTENDPQIDNKKAQAKHVGAQVTPVTPHIKHKGSRLLVKLLREDM